MTIEELVEALKTESARLEERIELAKEQAPDATNTYDTLIMTVRNNSYWRVLTLIRNGDPLNTGRQ